MMHLTAPMIVTSIGLGLVRQHPCSANERHKPSLVTIYQAIALDITLADARSFFPDRLTLTPRRASRSRNAARAHLKYP